MSHSSFRLGANAKRIPLGVEPSRSFRSAPFGSVSTCWVPSVGSLRSLYILAHTPAARPVRTVLGLHLSGWAQCMFAGLHLPESQPKSVRSFVYLWTLFFPLLRLSCEGVEHLGEERTNERTPWESWEDDQVKARSACTVDKATSNLTTLWCLEKSRPFSQTGRRMWLVVVCPRCACRFERIWRFVAPWRCVSRPSAPSSRPLCSPSPSPPTIGKWSRSSGKSCRYVGF